MQIDRFRVGLVSILTISTISVGLKTAFFPNQSSMTQFEIPQFLELSSSKIQSVSLSEKHQKTFQSGKRYQYQQKQTVIDIEIRHLVNTDGSVKEFLQVYQSMTLNQTPSIRRKEGIGFYGLFTHQNRSYLSACINPRGESTFTGTQFGRNRNLYDIRLDRIIPWLFTASSLRDQRCLWIQLSTPETSDRAYSILENTWFELYPTLHDRFSSV
jgi:cyanosortase A-associated protein